MTLKPVGLIAVTLLGGCTGADVVKIIRKQVYVHLLMREKVIFFKEREWNDC